MCPPAVMDTVPQVYIKGPEDGGVCVVCMTSGWYPEPQVHWRDSRGENLPAFSETHTKDAEGLFSTETLLVVRNSSVGYVTCSTFNPILGQEKAMFMVIPGESCPSLYRAGVVMVFLECAGLSVLRFTHLWLSAWAAEPFFPQATLPKSAFIVILAITGLLVLGTIYLLRREHSARLKVQRVQREKDELQKTKENEMRTIFT